MDVSLLIKEMERRYEEYKSDEDYDSADAIRELKAEIEYGKFQASIYSQFMEWTGDDVTFTEEEKQKLLYLLVKKHHGRHKLSSRSFYVSKIINGKPCILQTTINENPITKQDEFHLVINGDGYNEYDTDKFKELLIHF
jgi:hypothetical protein